jgi:hypothetical protein
MVDPRLDVVARLVGRVEGKARWLAGLATRVAVVGGAAAVLLWWVVAGGRIADWWQGTLASLLVLVLLLAPVAWLANVRFALLELLELPEKLSGVATRRTARLRAPAPAPLAPPDDEGPFAALRSLWGVLRDYGDVVGAWGAVAQLVAPPFWVLTALALVTVPAMVLVASVVALVTLVP